MNEPEGRFRILQPGAGSADGLADRPDGVVLADDPLVQFVLHAQQLRGFRLGELVDGNARPHRQHLGDALLVHLVEEVYAGAEGLGLGDLPPQQQFLLAVAQAAGLLEVLRLDGLLFAGGDDLDLGVDLQQAGGDVHPLEVQPRAGLVDQVDGLVGQVPVGDVAVGEVGRRHKRLVGDGDPVVRLVAVAQPLEDLDCLAHAGLGDLDRLEAALEGGVLLEMLAVLVERGCADGLQLATGQHGLQDRRRVDGALGRAGAHQGVQLVDEQDDVAAALDLLEDLLEALLEVAAVAAAGHQRPEIEGVELLVLDGGGHVVGGDALGETLHDGGLADAGFADEHRVVLGAPRQHLHHPLGLPQASRRPGPACCPAPVG